MMGILTYVGFQERNYNISNHETFKFSQRFLMIRSTEFVLSYPRGGNFILFEVTIVPQQITGVLKEKNSKII